MVEPLLFMANLFLPIRLRNNFDYCYHFLGFHGTEQKAMANDA